MARKKLEKITGATYDYDYEALKEGKVILKLISTPVGEPFVIDVGCPRDKLPVYYYAFGLESLIHSEILRRPLPPKANAYVCSSQPQKSIDDWGEHCFLAVQLYSIDDKNTEESKNDPNTKNPKLEKKL